MHFFFCLINLFYFFRKNAKGEPHKNRGLSLWKITISYRIRDRICRLRPRHTSGILLCIRTVALPTWHPAQRASCKRKPAEPCKAELSPAFAGGCPLGPFALPTSASRRHDGGRGREVCIPKVEVRLPKKKCRPNRRFITH